MYLNSVSITNYRCYPKFEINFKPGVNVLMGKNGAGKTTLFNALRYLLSVFMNTQKEVYSHYLINGTNTIKPIRAVYSDFYRIDGSGDPESTFSISADASMSDNNIKWSYTAENTGARAYLPKTSFYYDAFKAVVDQFRNEGASPLFAYYSDGFPHNSNSGRMSEYPETMISRMEAPMDHSFAYFKWDSEVSCATIWKKRFINALSQNNALKEKSRTKEEVAFLLEKINTFFSGIEDGFDIVASKMYSIVQDKDMELIITLKDGRQIPMEQLPAGYKRLFSIVLDLSYRSFILRDKNGMDPHGVAIIDEVDLHLHPELQQVVVSRFKRTFPNLQFIISSHSPLVITNLQTENTNCQILKLSNKKNKAVEMNSLYSMDFATAIYEGMDVSHSSDVIKSLADNIVKLERLKMTVQAEHYLNELKKYVSEEQFCLLKKDIDKRVSETIY